MSEARAVTNFSGNAVAIVLIGNWTRELDRPQLDGLLLFGDRPFDEADHDRRRPRRGTRVRSAAAACPPLDGSRDGDHYGQAAELGLST